jgi:hypothetical protein
LDDEEELSRLLSEFGISSAGDEPDDLTSPRLDDDEYTPPLNDWREWDD